MPTLTFTGNTSSDEFRRTLAQAMAIANPVDDLLELAERLRAYEQMYQMTSADFYQQYRTGTLAEPLQHCTEWAAFYDLFLKTRRIVEVMA